MRKLSLPKLPIILIGVLCLGGWAYAINTVLEGYRANSNTTTTVDASSVGGDCRKVTTPADGKDRFIPTKTAAEWNAFKAAAPGLGISLAACSAASSLSTCAGGTITYVGGYRIHTFTSNGALSGCGPGTVEYLVVAGGGGGGENGGGGAGGMIDGSLAISSNYISVTVGAGGSPTPSYGAPGFQGGNSSFSSITAIGGGAGDCGNGGAGGGGHGDGGCTNGGAGTPGQGYDGGESGLSEWGGGGGTGGPGTAGDGDQYIPGYGGPGRLSSISGSPVYYGWGGGAAGVGDGRNAPANTWNGGDSSRYGGSGIVVIRYPYSYQGPDSRPSYIPSTATWNGSAWTDVGGNFMEEADTPGDFAGCSFNWLWNPTSGFWQVWNVREDVSDPDYPDAIPGSGYSFPIGNNLTLECMAGWTGWNGWCISFQ